MFILYIVHIVDARKPGTENFSEILIQAEADAAHFFILYNFCRFSDEKLNEIKLKTLIFDQVK